MEQLWTFTDIGQRLGITRQRARKVSETYDDFPEPAATVGRAKAWRVDDIEAWIARHPERRPGRPKEDR